jgi:hypothetical protein
VNWISISKLIFDILTNSYPNAISIYYLFDPLDAIDVKLSDKWPFLANYVKLTIVNS